jgi:hypothetical protein
MTRAARGTRPRRAAGRHVELDPAFASIVRTFSREERVTFGGQGFGSRALRLDGKIFAMLSLRGDFVVKLPETRVAELIQSGKGKYFDTGRDRVMKEWVAVLAGPRSWSGLAREAYGYATTKDAQPRPTGRRTRG